MTVPNERTVQQDAIRIFKLLYYATEFCGLVGKQVTARYDPRDISEILVYLNNALVCWAKRSEVADQKPSLKEHMKTRNAYKRELRLMSHRTSINYFKKIQPDSRFFLRWCLMFS